LWLCRPPSLLNRNRKSRDIKCSSSERAIMQFRMSPGGRTPSSSRRRPELPPSSVTVTITDKSALNFFNPRKRVERPVPPPMETIFGPMMDGVLQVRERLVAIALYRIRRREGVQNVVGFRRKFQRMLQMLNCGGDLAPIQVGDADVVVIVGRSQNGSGFLLKFL